MLAVSSNSSLDISSSDFEPLVESVQSQLMSLCTDKSPEEHHINEMHVDLTDHSDTIISLMESSANYPNPRQTHQK